MIQSLRITPSSSHATSATNTTSSKFTSQPVNKNQGASAGAPSAPGLPDTLRLSHQQPQSLASSSAELPLASSAHPLESRLSKWTSTQAQLRSQILRRNFGIALPLRMSMEQQMVRKSDSFRPSVLGPASKVHDDILSGRDAELDWEDVYAGQDGLRGVVNLGGDGSGVGWHDEMERMVGMGKW